MNCTACQPLLVDYVHNELEPAADAAVFEHVKSCTDCAAAYQRDLQLGEALRSAFAEERDLPTSVIAGVRLAVHGHGDEAPSLSERLRAFLSPRVALPVAAVVAVLGFGVLRIGTVTQPPQANFSTGYFLREHVAQTMGSPVSDRAWSEYVLTSANDNAQPSP